MRKAQSMKVKSAITEETKEGLYQESDKIDKHHHLVIKKRSVSSKSLEEKYKAKDHNDLLNESLK